MRLRYVTRALVATLCVSLGHCSMMNKCLKVLANEEFHKTCSKLNSNNIRPCLVKTQQDADILIEAKIIGSQTPIPTNYICAARRDIGDADCISPRVQPDPQQNWQWTEWRKSSGISIRNIAITVGSTSYTCPYEERYTEPVYTDCLEAYNLGEHESGVYTISPDGSTQMRVYCEQDMDGGGWTVFQRRVNGTLDFARTWSEYKAGFGDPEGDYWLGNDNIHVLTKNQDQQVKFHLGITSGLMAIADYSEFWVGNEAESYLLHIAHHSGNAGDSMGYHNGATFSTEDKGAVRDCANDAGWWYKGCIDVNMHVNYDWASYGLVTMRWQGSFHPLTYTACMLKTKAN